MATFVAILRFFVDLFMGRLFSGMIVAVCGLVGISSGIAGFVALIAVIAIVINPKTRVLWNLIREYVVHLLCRAISLVTPVPETFYGPRWAKY